MHNSLILRRLSIPFIFLSIILNINPKLSEVRASNKINPANDKDLDLYRSMGITYICTTSAKGTDADFEKSLVVAANLFSTVIQQKHGCYIKEGKKWMLNKYGFNSKWSMNLYSKSFYDAFFEFHPEFSNYKI